MIKIKYPKGQYLKLTYIVEGIPIYVVTREHDKFGKFYLYQVNADGSVLKLKSKESPLFDEIN